LSGVSFFYNLVQFLSTKILNSLKTKTMKTKLFLLLSILLTITKGFAQAPQAIPYQAVARDAAGTALTNRTLSVRFKIHDTTATGIVLYSESQTIVTNSVGTFTANIGQGTVLSGSFAGINWVAPKFMQAEIDINGGTAFVDMGTKQMLSVPYALNSADWVEEDYPDLFNIKKFIQLDLP
jgi:hypothetical protein